ncbi:hypothetical protein J6590_035097 [Homalodisca vitripennis]|nr:hypothetical protein J6590_035097 [Homalodisca vitripennis]
MASMTVLAGGACGCFAPLFMHAAPSTQRCFAATLSAKASSGCYFKVGSDRLEAVLVKILTFFDHHLVSTPVGGKRQTRL